MGIQGVWGLQCLDIPEDRLWRQIDTKSGVEGRDVGWVGSLGELAVPSDCCQGRCFPVTLKLTWLFRDPPGHPYSQVPLLRRCSV